MKIIIEIGDENMFGTVIIDAYKRDEKEQIANAIDDLCSPSDTYGWASAGIYCFWDYYTKDVLYIGLAADLSDRFKQHNGITIVDDNSCKRKQIDEYFNKKEKIGYSIFVQSPLSQPITHRNEKEYRKMLGDEFSREDYVGEEGKEHIKQVEGILIETYRKANGKFPLWNRMGGSLYGQKVASIGNYDIVKSFIDFQSNPLVSRCSLRELSEDPMYAAFENYLHAVRMSMLMSGMTLMDSLNFHNKFDSMNIYKQMIDNGYFDKRLKV